LLVQLVGLVDCAVEVVEVEVLRVVVAGLVVVVVRVVAVLVFGILLVVRVDEARWGLFLAVVVRRIDLSLD
ncbi:hypothetical protein AAHH80_36220, partial [Burkholderia pseudomallei]